IDLSESSSPGVILMSSPESDPTDPSLLRRVQDAEDTAAWQRYFRKYKPLIEGWCRDYREHNGRRLQEAAVDDVVGMVLAKISQTMKQGFVYDPKKKYRGWLWTVVNSQVQEFLARKYGQVAPASGDSGVQETLVQYPAPDTAEELEQDLHVL